ncbi:MAG: type II secretion system major pseudopilin GspG [Pseudomonadota bacterium]
MMNATPRVAKGRQHGFTLIEIMVVVVILGILATLVLPNVMGRADDARVTKAKSDVQALMSALNLYRLDHLRYPAADVGLEALVNPPPGTTRNYLQKSTVPRDPWGNPYQYVNPGVRGEIDVLSFGADGAPGGEGFNADIGSWETS